MDGCEVVMTNINELVLAQSWLTDALQIFGIITMVGIIIFGILALHYDTKWFKYSKWTSYSVIKIGCALVSFVWTAMYIYILSKIILGNPIDVNWFGAVFVRPAILLTQFVLALSARNRFHSLMINKR